MNRPVEAPEPAYTKVQMSGPPEAVARLMAVLGGSCEIIFDHRADPNARGDVSCTARVVTYGADRTQALSGRAEAVVQSTLFLDTARWPGLGEDEGTQRLENGAAAALAAVTGVRTVSSRLVALMPSASAHRP
ncbi:hypothetical protein AB0C68_30020 [Streptomyces tendae]|uniref:hypothetical protein n=1 Tax=Streptomyces tendae TaxID=1932 RepID=UPI0033F89A2F